jgi:uncharacterized cupredoxin-like copper-binding protein
MRRLHPRWLAPVALLVAGIAVVVAGTGDVVDIIGGAIIAIAATVAISLAFLEVGLSEDRARERGEYGPPPER